MKKIILVFILLSSINSFSQDVVETIGKESCECVSKKGLDFKKTPIKTLQMEFGLCILASYEKHKEEYDKIEKLDLTDESSLTRYGKTVAVKMFAYCPDVLMALGESKVAEKENSESETLEIEGTIQEFITEQFVTISVKDKNSKVSKFLLLDYFPTASLFTNQEIKAKSKVKITYSNQELYDPSTKEFRFYKVIKVLEKL